MFLEKYPEIFNNSSENEVEMDIDEGKTRPKKPNLVEIRKRLLCKRTTEAFTDYRGIESDSSLTLVGKIIKLQEVISNATRRKIHYASLQGQLLEDCFRESKEAYKRMLEWVNMKKRWELFLRKLYKLVLKFNDLTFCTVSLRFICYNIKVIEEICKPLQKYSRQGHGWPRQNFIFHCQGSLGYYLHSLPRLPWQRGIHGSSIDLVH